MSAFIVSNRNIVIPGPAGAEPCKLSRGYMGPVPDWVLQNVYFKALVADGKIVLSQSRKKKDRGAEDDGQKAVEDTGGKKKAPQDDSGG